MIKNDWIEIDQRGDTIRTQKEDETCRRFGSRLIYRGVPKNTQSSNDLPPQFSPSNILRSQIVIDGEVLGM